MNEDGLIFEVSCSMPEEGFDKWADVPEHIKGLIQAQCGLPCDGGGVPGWWCRRCHWVITRDLPEEESVREG